MGLKPQWKPPGFWKNLYNQVTFQFAFTWGTRLSKENIKKMLEKPKGLAKYALKTVIHNISELTGTEADDVRDLLEGIYRGKPDMIIENICDIIVDKAQDFTGIEIPKCINLFKNITLRRWSDARQDIHELGVEFVCHQCGVEEEEIMEFCNDPSVKTAVNICMGIVQEQASKICVFLAYIPPVELFDRRRLHS